MDEPPVNPPESAAAFPPHPPATSPLEQVVDDYEPRLAATEWAVEQMYDDRTFEDIVADLVSCGWSLENAEEVAEVARQRTRGHRGAVTRDDVVEEADRMYRRSMSGRWFAGLPMLAAAWKLMHSLVTLGSLRRAHGRGRRGG